MSLDKSIQSGKEHRKPYIKAKAVDKHCQNHGHCKWCESSRLYHILKMEASFKQSMKEYEDE